LPSLHVLREGLCAPSASGSGVVIADLHDKQWSGPAAIVVDVDVPEDVDAADVVVAINNNDDSDAVSRQSEVPGKGLDVEPCPIPESDAYAARVSKAPGEDTANFLDAKSKGHLLQSDPKHLVVRPADGENENSYRSAETLLRRYCPVRSNRRLMLQLN
jgi:hypothetical protein